MGTREEFVDRYMTAILDLPQDVKAVFDVIDDPAVADEGRVAACGALVSLLQPGDLVPDSFGPLGLIDDAITLRLAVDLALPEGHPRRAEHAARHPEFYGALTADIASAREFLGQSFAILDQRIRKIGALEHKGKKASFIAGDDRVSTWLFEEVDEAMTEMEIEEDELATSMRKVDQLVTHLRRRMTSRS